MNPYAHNPHFGHLFNGWLGGQY